MLWLQGLTFLTISPFQEQNTSEETTHCAFSLFLSSFLVIEVLNKRGFSSENLHANLQPILSAKLPYFSVGYL